MVEIHLSFADFSQLYSTEEACAEKLYNDKWPTGFRCPVCRHAEASVIRTRRLPLYECKKCRHQTSLTAGTVMEKSKTTLVKWFQAIYLLSHGTTATQLSDAILVTYKTAWLIVHKIRHAIRHFISKSPLTGNVQLLESRYGATSFAAQFRAKFVHHPLLAAATISEDGKMHHVRLERVPAKYLFKGLVTKDAVQSFIHQHIAPTANTTATTGVYHYSRYKPLYQFSRGIVRYMNQTYFGIGAKHLKAYLDEYSYRHQFTSQNQSSLAELLHQCSIRPALPYPQLVKAAS